eukprot:1159649-Pelagomonas_calceolata.AAC.5
MFTLRARAADMCTLTAQAADMGTLRARAEVCVCVRARALEAQAAASCAHGGFKQNITPPLVKEAPCSSQCVSLPSVGVGAHFLWK